MSPPAERGPARRRWTGIRAKLLVLLLPVVALTLLVDSLGDHETRMGLLDSAYDEGLLQPLGVINKNLSIDVNGKVDLTVPSTVQAMFELNPALHRFLHVGLSPLDRDSGATLAERTLMGVNDLPAPPADATPVPPPASFGDALGSLVVFYTAPYQGWLLRVASLRREVQDAAGRRYQLRMQVTYGTGRRNEAREFSVRHELVQDMSVLTITTLLVWVGIGWALRPLERLRRSVRQRHPNDLQPLDASDVPYEVAPLVDEVNHHIANQRQLLAEQGRFLADASHQLRTPLAIMMTQAGYALRERDPELLRETLRAIITQLDRSRRLSDQLLAMADAGRPKDDMEPAPLIDLNTVAREVVLQYLPLAREKHQDLGWVDIRGEEIQDGAGVPDPAAPVRAQAAELHEALANLLHNAIRHALTGGNITVGVRVEGDTVLAEICDDGPGIAPQLREAVFERFGRGHASDGHSTGGAGLGLAIARAYARRNGGDIVLADGRAPAGGAAGLCVRLQMPRASGV